MKYIRLFFTAESVPYEGSASADYNKTNSNIISESVDPNDDEDDDDDIDEIDLDEAADDEIVETDTLDIEDDEIDNDDEDEDEDDDDDVVSENGEKKSGIRKALQQWSNDNARDIAEDDSTPLRSNL